MGNFNLKKMRWKNDEITMGKLNMGRDGVKPMKTLWENLF